MLKIRYTFRKPKKIEWGLLKTIALLNTSRIHSNLDNNADQARNDSI